MLWLGFFACFAVYSLRAVAMFFNIFRKFKEIGVLWPILPDYVISYDCVRTDLPDPMKQPELFEFVNLLNTSSLRTIQQT